MATILKLLARAQVRLTGLRGGVLLKSMCMESKTEDSLRVVNPEKCYATGEGLGTAILGTKSTATVHAVSWKGSPCLEPIQSLECEFESKLPVPGARVRGIVKDKGLGQYEISYQPVTKGRCLLHVRVEGLNIQGSPFEVRVAAPLLHFPAQSTIDGIQRPWGVTFNHGGEIIVSGANRVSIYSLSGEKLRTFGTHDFSCGSSPGEFSSPRGVAVDDLNNILVADRNNNRIQKFTSDGSFLETVGTWGVKPLQFINPRGIAFNMQNKKVYVADSENHRIQVLNSDLTFSGIIAGGQRSGNNGWFARPNDVACDSTGNVYVADTDNDRIQVFTADMEFLRKFDGCGRHGKKLYPTGIAVDSRGMVFVSPFHNYGISAFTGKGEYVTSIGKRHREDWGDGYFREIYPGSLAVDDCCDFLCVPDYNNDCIQIF